MAGLGLSGALAGLSAAYPGYVQGRMQEDRADMADLALAEAKRDPLGQVALANALKIWAQGGEGTPNMGPQSPMPGQSLPPMAPPGAVPPSPASPGGMPQGAPQAPPPGGGGIFGGMPGWAPGERPMGMGAPPGAPGGGPPPTAVPPGAQGGGPVPFAQRFPGPGGAPPPPGGGLPGAQPGGGMPPRPSGMPMGGGQMPGTMDWKQLVNNIVKANPNAPPDVIASAINQAMKLPMVTQEGRLNMQLISAQLREQSLMQQLQIAQMRDTTTQRGQDIGYQKTTDRIAAGPGLGKGTASERGYAAFKAIPGNENKTQLDYERELSAARAGGRAQPRTEAEQKKVDSVIQQIDAAMELVKPGAPAVTGIYGKGKRIVEGVGGNLGLTNKTEASRFQAMLRLIQQEYPRLLSGSKVTNAQERLHADEILKGLSPLTGRTQAYDDLQTLKQILTGEPITPPVGAGRPGASQPAPVSPGGWKIERVGP